MKTGVVGEEIVLKYLRSNGFELLERNYRRPWGEIDIVVKKDSTLFFVEVKAVEAVESKWREVMSFKRPEERVTLKKMEKMRKIVQTYLVETKSGDSDWVFVVCGVLIDFFKKRAKVSFIKELL